VSDLGEAINRTSAWMTNIYTLTSLFAILIAIKPNLLADRHWIETMMDKIPYRFSQDIFTSPIIASCHGDPHLLKLPGENSFFDPLWMSNSDRLIFDDSNRCGQFVSFW